MVGGISRNKKEVDSRTKTIQLMEFIVGDSHFGINVAKIVEIMKYVQYPITPMPNSNPFVEGIFRPRTDTMTVINLAAYLGLPPSQDQERDILIITKLNNVKTAFHVHDVVSIDTIDVDKIEKPDRTIYGSDDGMATGVASFDDKLITIIDFEKILFDISPTASIMVDDITNMGVRERSSKPVLISEDSPLLERLLLESLEKAGYTNVACTSNGKEAWDLLMTYKASSNPIEEHVCAVISDIEMPLLDGHTLLKNIKEDPHLRKIPVIIFSSLISPGMEEIGAKLGAAASISKPEIANLVGILDKHIL